MGQGESTLFPDDQSEAQKKKSDPYKTRKPTGPELMVQTFIAVTNTWQMSWGRKDFLQFIISQISVNGHLALFLLGPYMVR